MSLHEQLLRATRPLIGGGLLGVKVNRVRAALRAVVELHKPELFGGVVACVACSPGMPPHVLVQAPCGTVQAVARALGVDDRSTTNAETCDPCGGTT